MAETDLADWLTVPAAAAAIGCSPRTIERLGRARKLEQRLRRQEGTPPVAVYNPEDVARLASERRPAPSAFVLPANGNGNDKEHGSTAGIYALRKPEGSYSGEDLIRGLAVLLSKVLQSPPSPPVAVTVAETRYLDVEQAAAVLYWTPRDVRRAIRTGELAARNSDCRNWRAWRIRRKDVEAL